MKDIKELIAKSTQSGVPYIRRLTEEQANKEIEKINKFFNIKEEKKMAESQSRYGIMEELNTNKIKEKEELAVLESQLRQSEINFQKQKAELEADIAFKKANYKGEHANWKIIMKLEQTKLKQELQNRMNKIDEQIQEADKKLEPDTQEWIESKQNELKNLTENFDNYKKEQEAKITTKKEIIAEMDNAIKSLKEISKEHVKEKKE